MYTTTKKTLALLAVAVVAMAGVFIITTADSGESDAVTISADSSGSCSLTAGDYLCIRGTSGDRYSLHSVSAPPWLSYNSTAETLTGNAVAGTYEVTFKIMYYDGHGNHDVTIDIYVSPANQQPTYYTYTLIYDAAGGVGGPGTVHGQSQVSNNCVFTIPSSQPTRGGYAFSGWGWIPNSHVARTAGDTITLNSPSDPFTIYAQWSSAPTTTAKPVSEFQFSYPDSNNGKVVKFTDRSANTPTSWSWDFGDGSTSTAQNPTHTYSESRQYTVKLIASNATGAGAVCQKAITVNAAPGATACTVTYDTDGGTAISPSAVTVGSNLTLPTPVKTGSTFLGWYSGTMLAGNPGTIYIVPGNVTLTAKWASSAITTYTVTFFSSDGNSLFTQTVASGSRATEPPASAVQHPTGSPFSGWATSSGTIHQFDKPITSDMNLYAKYGGGGDGGGSVWDNQLLTYAVIGVVAILLVLAIARTV